MTDAGHHQHPDAQFAQSTHDPHEIPEGVNVPDAAAIFRPWHLWLVYGLTLFTLVLSAAVGYNVTTTKAVDSRVRTIVAENRAILCDWRAIQQATPPQTARERAADRYLAESPQSCGRPGQ